MRTWVSVSSTKRISHNVERYGRQNGQNVEVRIEMSAGGCFPRDSCQKQDAMCRITPKDYDADTGTPTNGNHGLVGTAGC